MTLEQAIEQYHKAVDEFSRGNPESVKSMYSRRDDVSLANPFGPAVRGWEQVSKALDFASSRFSDGEVTPVEPIATYASVDLATILEIEQWKTKVGGRHEAANFALRVSTTFRREQGAWKIVHRHADRALPFDPDGPLRGADPMRPS